MDDLLFDVAPFRANDVSLPESSDMDCDSKNRNGEKSPVQGDARAHEKTSGGRNAERDEKRGGSAQLSEVPESDGGGKGKNSSSDRRHDGGSLGRPNTGRDRKRKLHFDAGSLRIVKVGMPTPNRFRSGVLD